MTMTSADIATIASGAIGFTTAILVYYLGQAKQNDIQRADTYFKLEVEASRLFEIARTNRKLVDYLDGKPTGGNSEDIEHELKWYLPQVLNIFEISISFYRKKIFDRSVFRTWIAWYLELSSYKNFPQFWADFELHYKPELREIMRSGIRISSVNDRTEDEKTHLFYKTVSNILGDRSILKYYDNFK